MGLDLLPETKECFRVAEGIHGTFYYHLRRPDDHFGLCGDRVMHTSIPVSAWGARTDHIKERWCSRCEGAASEIEENEIRAGLQGAARVGT